MMAKKKNINTMRFLRGPTGLTGTVAFCRVVKAGVACCTRASAP